VAAMQRALEYCENIQLICVTPQAQESVADKSLAVEKTPHIMLLDDNSLFLTAAERVLDGLGLCGRRYTKPDELIEDVRGKRVLPSLIITDLNMPEMSGFDVAQSLMAAELRARI
jgi:CheY-like chemotaxis protein